MKKFTLTLILLINSNEVKSMEPDSKKPLNQREINYFDSIEIFPGLDLAIINNPPKEEEFIDTQSYQPGKSSKSDKASNANAYAQSTSGLHHFTKNESTEN